ncbi:hypothetical protein YC2023_108271 [Brassica napus]
MGVPQHTQDVRMCPSAHTGRSRLSVCVRVYPSQDVRGCPSVHITARWSLDLARKPFPWTVRVILALVGCLFNRQRTFLGVRQHTQDIRVCPSAHTGRLWLFVCVRVCPSTHTGRPWVSVITHRTSVCVRQHTQDDRGCPIVFLCVRHHTQDVRGLHTGCPWVSASTHRTSVAVCGCPLAHTGRLWLSVCVRQHTQDVRRCPSAHTELLCVYVSTHRTSVAVRVCLCVSVSTQMTFVAVHHTHRTSVGVHQHTQDVRVCLSAHTGRLWLSVCVRQHTQDVRSCPSVHDRTQDLDQDVEQTQHGDQDDQISPTEVQPFSRSRSTDRAVYRIDPRAPGRDLRMDPRPDDQISQTTGVLPRPIRHSRANSQARTHDHREESDSGLSLSFLARLGRTARPDQADHDLSNHFDDFMMINASNYSKGRILKLSEDLGRAISSSVHGSSTINHAGSLTKSNKEKHPRLSVSQTSFKYALNTFDEFVDVQKKPNRWSKEHVNTSKGESDPRRRLLQFDVQQFCDNFVKGVDKALKDVSKSQKKSTSTRAPVAEPSLFISKKAQGESGNHFEELKDFSDSLPIFDESDEELIESLMFCEKDCDLPSLETEFNLDNEQAIVELTVLQPELPSSLVLSPQVFEEEPLDFPHQCPCLDTRICLDDDLGPIFDEEDEPGPIFDEEATSITSIAMENYLCFDPGTTPAPLPPDLQEHCEEPSSLYSLPDMFVKVTTEVQSKKDISTVRRRFFSPSIREYQISKGDSCPRKNRPEPKPILHEPKVFPQSFSCLNQKHYLALSLSFPNRFSPWPDFEIDKSIFGNQLTCLMLAHDLDDYPKGLDPDLDVLRIEKPFHYFFGRFDVVSLVALNKQDKHDQTQDLDQDVEQTQHGDQDDQISPTEVQPFSRSRSTDRAVYRIDPRAPGRDLRMDPRPDDQISQTTGVLPRPIRHSRANSQARTHDHREESDSGLSLSFLARLGRTARPDQADHDLSNHFDDFMMINASNYSKGRILKLSEDLGRAISSSVHGSSTINHAGSLTSVLLLTANDLITRG